MKPSLFLNTKAAMIYGYTLFQDDTIISPININWEATLNAFLLSSKRLYSIYFCRRIYNLWNENSIVLRAKSSDPLKIKTCVILSPPISVYEDIWHNSFLSKECKSAVEKAIYRDGKRLNKETDVDSEYRGWLVRTIMDTL